MLVDTDLSFKKTQVLLCHAPSSGDTEVPTGAGGPWTGSRAALREPKLESRWCNPAVSHALRFYKRCVWCSSYPHGSGPRGTEGAVERQPGLGHLPDGTFAYAGPGNLSLLLAPTWGPPGPHVPQALAVGLGPSELVWAARAGPRGFLGEPWECWL